MFQQSMDKQRDGTATIILKSISIKFLSIYKQNVGGLCKNKEVIILKRNIYYEVKYNDTYNLNAFILYPL